MENHVKVNDIIFITIKKLGINGEGVGYYKRQAIFVKNALPGEEVEVKVTEAYDKYAIGEITKTKVVSSDRVEPKCPYYEKCGGCQLQHLSYPAQLREKREMVIEALNRYYDGDASRIKVYDCKGMEEPWNYRNKSSLPCRHDGKKVVVGMYAQNSNFLVYIDKCIVEDEIIKEVREEILEKLTKAGVDVYNPKLRDGSLKYIVIRAFSKDNVQVTFVLNKEDRKIINVLKELKVTSSNYSINSDPKSIEIFGSEVINVAGEKTINGKLGALNFEISPNAFFQLNTMQTTVLYDEIKKACRLTKEENVLDCYCGIGSIGMYLASNAKEVRGIDTNKEGIEDANKFARLNKVKNAKFYSGNILPHLNQFAKEGFIPDVVVVDPPRKGLELNFINYLQKHKVKKIIYVSCNPATLSKNLNHLQRDYIIRYIQPVDMFPQTSNVECVVCLERR